MVQRGVLQGLPRRQVVLKERQKLELQEGEHPRKAVLTPRKGPGPCLTWSLVFGGTRWVMGSAVTGEDATREATGLGGGP